MPIEISSRNSFLVYCQHTLSRFMRKITLTQTSQSESISFSLSLSLSLPLSLFFIFLFQCDQMARFSLQYLAIYNNANLPNNVSGQRRVKILAQLQEKSYNKHKNNFDFHKVFCC